MSDKKLVKMSTPRKTLFFEAWRNPAHGLASAWPARSKARLMKSVCGDKGSFITCKSFQSDKPHHGQNPLPDLARADEERLGESESPSVGSTGSAFPVPRKGPSESTRGAWGGREESHFPKKGLLQNQPLG